MMRMTVQRFVQRLIRIRPLTDQQLLERSLWDEVDGEPMNAYALEYMRRQDAREAESVSRMARGT